MQEELLEKLKGGIKSSLYKNLHQVRRDILLINEVCKIMTSNVTKARGLKA